MGDNVAIKLFLEYCTQIKLFLEYGSLLLPDTAGEKLRRLLDRVYELRAAEQRRALEGVPDGEPTGINVTMLKGGAQSNVVCDPLI